VRSQDSRIINHVPKLVRMWGWEVLCFGVYLALASTQLFLHPITGLADNGDFPKVLGNFDLCDPNNQRDAQRYVYPSYIINERCRWDGRLPSSETVFVRILKQIAVATDRTSIRITGAGKAHLSVMLAALAILLWALHTSPPLFRFGIPPLAILIFSDVLYVSYLNSFYMDVASMVFLLLTASLAVAAILRPRVWIAIAFGVAGVLLALSKTQHVFTGFLFAVLAAWFARHRFRSAQRPEARAWTASAVAISLAGVLTLAMTPADYKAEPLYSLIFFTLVPASENHADALIELGLPAADLRLVGTHAYSAESPITTPEFREAFIRQVNYRTLALFYLHHPSIPLRLVGQGLTLFGPSMRPGNIANYQREDGFPPGTLSQRFALWSHLRAWTMFVFPAQIPIFYGIMGLGALLSLRRPSWAARWPLYPLVLILVIAGALEFPFAVLLDATETARHLFFFHVITEILIVCAVAAAFGLVNRRPALPTTNESP
jgi:hypothetical protein